MTVSKEEMETLSFSIELPEAPSVDEFDLDDEAFKREFLKGVEELAEEAGDWRDHLPYEAAIGYHSDDAIQAKYQAHVDDCAYCQELIDTLQPSPPLLGRLSAIVSNDVVYSDVSDSLPKTEARGAGGTKVFAIAASLLLGLAVSWIVLDTIRETDFDGLSAAFFDKNPDLLSWEQSDNPADRFAAARVYLAATHPDIAYERVGEGLQLGGLEPTLASMVSTAPRLEANSLASLQSAERELEMLKAKPSLSIEEQFRLVQLQAKLGNHHGAFTVLEEYLIEIGANETVLAAYRDNLIIERP